jgi:hypothetical protein
MGAEDFAYFLKTPGSHLFVGNGTVAAPTEPRFRRRNSYGVSFLRIAERALPLGDAYGAGRQKAD